MPRPSRPARLQAIERELRQLAAEYQLWRDALPDNLQESGLAAKLDDAIAELEELADEVSCFDFPRIGMAY